MNQIVLLIFLVMTVLPMFGGLIDLYVDWYWFQEIAYPVIFTTTLKTQILMGLLFGAAFFLLMAGNLLLASRHRAGEWASLFEAELPIPPLYRALLIKRLPLIILAFSFVTAFVGGLRGAAYWKDALLFRHGGPFGLADPIHQLDVGFYVFRLPFLGDVQGWLTGGLLLATVCTGLVYLFKQALRISPSGLFIEQRPRLHLFVLAGLLLLAKAWGYWLEQFTLLASRQGIVSGALYVDVNARLPVLNVLVILAILAAAVVMLSSLRRGWALPLLAVGSVFGMSLVGGSIYPELLHRFRIVPNELVMQRPYLEHNIAFTRLAYGLNTIETKEFPAEENLTKEDLRLNDLTIKNVRLWDHRPLLATYSQLQQIRTYYNFVGVDNDRYMINGEYRQVMLAPRELSYRNLPGGANWINEHLTYTHGYGVAFGPVNRITREGLPEFFIKDIPPASTIELKVTRPEIYYGELPNDYVFVKTRGQEFDYPVGDKNEYTTYQGKGGIPIQTLTKKLLLAAKVGSLKVMLSNDITPESRVLLYRNVMERVRKATPFVRYDRDPYLVITPEGRLVWIVDGYTTTDQFPYAQPVKGIGNYIRNSVKATLDAYDGDLAFYMSDPTDPVIRAYAEIFPGLLRPIEAMPSGLRAHLRYPEDLFLIQSRLLATYHMQDPQIFYNKEDLWSIPQKGEGEMEPYYTIMKLPKETKEEFVLLLPYTPARRDNMSALLAARSDGGQYGKLIVYLFPKQKLVYGPRQVEARIDQDAYISQQLTLWNQTGSQVIRGSLLVIPIKDSLLYVEPLYLAASAGSIPELRRVIVAYGNQLTMEDNLELALAKIFGGVMTGEARPKAGTQPAAVREEDLVRAAYDRFKAAQGYLRDGRWTEYGDAIKKVEELLRTLSQRKK